MALNNEVLDMYEQLQNILNFNKSIINVYCNDYNNYWEFIKDLKNIIINIGNLLRI